MGYRRKLSREETLKARELFQRLLATVSQLNQMPLSREANLALNEVGARSCNAFNVLQDCVQKKYLEEYWD